MHRKAENISIAAWPISRLIEKKDKYRSSLSENVSTIYLFLYVEKSTLAHSPGRMTFKLSVSFTAKLAFSDWSSSQHIFRASESWHTAWASYIYAL